MATTIFDKVTEPGEMRMGQSTGKQMEVLSAKMAHSRDAQEDAALADDMLALLETERRNALLRDYVRRKAFADSIIHNASKDNT
jgi:hypothetical protein